MVSRFSKKQFKNKVEARFDFSFVWYSVFKIKNQMKNKSQNGYWVELNQLVDSHLGRMSLFQESSRHVNLSWLSSWYRFQRSWYRSGCFREPSQSTNRTWGPLTRPKYNKDLFFWYNFFVFLEDVKQCPINFFIVLLVVSHDTFLSGKFREKKKNRLFIRKKW